MQLPTGTKPMLCRHMRVRGLFTDRNCKSTWFTKRNRSRWASYKVEVKVSNEACHPFGVMHSSPHLDTARFSLCGALSKLLRYSYLRLLLVPHRATMPNAKLGACDEVAVTQDQGTAAWGEMGLFRGAGGWRMDPRSRGLGAGTGNKRAEIASKKWRWLVYSISLVSCLESRVA